MTELFLTVIVSTLGVWMVTWVVWYRVIKDFVRKFPKEAEEVLPYYGSFFAHQSGLFYIFRDDVKELMRSDEELWALRELAMILLILSILVPTGGGLVLLIQL